MNIIPPDDWDASLRGGKKSNKVEQLFDSTFDKRYKPTVIAFCKSRAISRDLFFGDYAKYFMEMFERLRDVYVQNYQETPPTRAPRITAFNAQLNYERTLANNKYGNVFTNDLFQLLVPEFQNMFLIEEQTIQKLR